MTGLGPYSTSGFKLNCEMIKMAGSPVKLIVVALLSFSCWGTRRVDAQGTSV